MPQNRDFAKWLEAQIALQQDQLNLLTNSEARASKEGQIALLKMELRKITKK